MVTKEDLRNKINEIEETWLYVNDELIGCAPKNDVVAYVDCIEGMKDNLVDMFFESTKDINRIEESNSFKPLTPKFYEFIKNYCKWNKGDFEYDMSIKEHNQLTLWQDSIGIKA